MLSETHLIGLKTRECVLSLGSCSALKPHGLVRCGLTEARPPYRMVRPKLGFSEMVIGLEGSGRVWSGDAWQELRPGEGYFAGEGYAQAFFAPPGKRWSFVWLHMGTSRGVSYVPAGPPCVMKADGAPLAQAVASLHREVLGPNDPGVVVNLAALVGAYGLRLAGGRAADERLWQVWKAVDADLGRAWTLGALAAIARMSEEHLRRRCWQELGKTPMARVADLRMQRAAVLLKMRSAKVQAIAEEVGYGSLYSFSAAFKRWSGVAPSVHRGEARSMKAKG